MSVVRLSEAASIGLHVSLLMANRPEELLRTRDMAERLGFSAAHVTKVIQRLGRAGLVRSVRGPRGGSSLTGPPAEITLLQIYEAIEGPLTPLGCLLSKPLCKGGCCLLGGLLQEVSRSMHHHFAKTTLADAVTALREQECRV